MFPRATYDSSLLILLTGCMVIIMINVINPLRAEEKTLHHASKIKTFTDDKLPTQQKNAASTYGLERLYQMAKDFDKNVRMAAYQAEAAGYALKKNKGVLLPQVDIYASGKIYDTKQPYEENYTGTDYQLNVTQPLFQAEALYNKNLAEVAVHREQLNYRIALKNLAMQLASAYFAILKQENLLISLQAEEAALQNQFSGAQLSFAAGTLSVVDLADIEAQYRALAARRIAQNNTLKSFYDGLSNMIGQQLDHLPYPEHIKLEGLRLQKNLHDFIQIVNEQNLELLQEKLAMQVQKIQYSRAKSAHYPELQLEASHQFSKRDDHLAVTQSTEYVEMSTLGISFHLPIYHGGSISAHADQQQALLRKQIAIWEQKKLEAEETARQRFREHEALWDMIAANKRWFDAAEKSYQATQSGFASNTRNQTDLLNAQSKLFAAQRDYIATQYDLIINSIELSSLSGTLDADFLQLLEKVISIKQ